MQLFFKRALFLFIPEVDSFIVPIAVGAALGGLVVLVLTDLICWLQETL